MRDFQNRLAARQELIKRRIKDNNIELAGHPTDCIRIQYKKNDEGDITSRVISKATVESVIFPPLKDVPYRKISCDGSGSYKITSLVDSYNEEATERYSLSFPKASDLNVGDLIVRVFLDPDVAEPIILVMKISEILGTFGHLMLLGQKCNCVLTTEDIPEKTLQVIGEMAKRRLAIGF